MDICSLLLRHSSLWYYSEPNKHLSAWMGRQEKEEFKKEEEGSNPTEILYIWIS